MKGICKWLLWCDRVLERIDLVRAEMKPFRKKKIWIISAIFTILLVAVTLQISLTSGTGTSTSPPPPPLTMNVPSISSNVSQLVTGQSATVSATANEPGGSSLAINVPSGVSGSGQSCSTSGTTINCNENVTTNTAGSYNFTATATPPPPNLVPDSSLNNPTDPAPEFINTGYNGNVSVIDSVLVSPNGSTIYESSPGGAMYNPATGVDVGGITLILINASTHAVTVPSLYGYVQAMTAANGYLYLAESGSSAVVQVLNETTNAIVDTISLPPYQPTAITYGNGNVYVLFNGQNEYSVINASTNTLVSTVSSLPAESPTRIVYANGYLYIYSSYFYELYVFNASTGALVTTINYPDNYSSLITSTMP